MHNSLTMCSKYIRPCQVYHGISFNASTPSPAHGCTIPDLSQSSIDMRSIFSVDDLTIVMQDFNGNTATLWSIRDQGANGVVCNKLQIYLEYINNI